MLHSAVLLLKRLRYGHKKKPLRKTRTKRSITTSKSAGEPSNVEVPGGIKIRSQIGVPFNLSSVPVA